jgi:uncharacterized protein YbaR (Trm112 family)
MDILRCPACVSGDGSEAEGAVERADPGQLDLWGDSWLVCQDCQRKYPIRNQVPVLLIEEGDVHRETSLDDLGPVSFDAL